jgi:hypothetical protein
MRHTDEEIEAASQQFEEWAAKLPGTAQFVDASDLRAIAELADSIARREAKLTTLVAVARARGRSWGRIGIALGVSRQGARQRFAGKIDD